MFHQDLSANISALIEDFKTYVAECPLKSGVILKVADLANFESALQ